MRLWIDAAGLHSFERCQRGGGKRTDALDQLQFAVQLVFAQTLHIGSFRDPVYSEKTRVGIAALQSVGFDRDCVQEVDPDFQALEAVYIHAADKLASEVEARDPTSIEPSPGYSQLAPIVEEAEKDFHNAIIGNLADGDRRHLYERYENKVNNGVIIMITKSEALYAAIRRFVGNGRHWTSQHSAALASVCRICIHEELATLYSAAYSPNRQRAKGFTSSVQSAVANLAALKGVELEQRLPVPPVAAHLADRSGGNPQRLFESVIALRNDMAPLRGRLQVFMDNPDIQTGRAEMEREVREVLEATRSRVAGENPAGSAMKALLLSAVIVAALYDVQTASALAALAAPFLAHTASPPQQQRARAAVLTEVAFAAQTIREDAVRCLEDGVSSSS